MATPLTERTILMQPPQNLVVNEAALHADTLIQQATGLSTGSQMMFGFYQAHILTAGVWSINPVVYFVFYLTSSNDSTVASGLATLQTRWPGWVISTYSRNLVFG